MTTASEQAAAHLTANTAKQERTGETRGETGDYARLRELMGSDNDFTDDEATEFADLAEKWRAGTLEGRPKRMIYKRKSIAGERNEDSAGRSPSSSPTAASESAAAHLLGRSS